MAGFAGSAVAVAAEDDSPPSWFGQVLTSGDGGASTQRSAPLEDEIIGIDFDSVWFRAAEGFDGESRFGADHVDRFQFRISFRIDAQFHGHAESVQRLLDLAVNSKTLR